MGDGEPKFLLLYTVMMTLAGFGVDRLASGSLIPIRYSILAYVVV
jgi:hypothetical protein